jgi:hypothetical protein
MIGPAAAFRIIFPRSRKHASIICLGFMRSIGFLRTSRSTNERIIVRPHQLQPRSPNRPTCNHIGHVTIRQVARPSSTNSPDALFYARFITHRATSMELPCRQTPFVPAETMSRIDVPNLNSNRSRNNNRTQPDLYPLFHPRSRPLSRRLSRRVTRLPSSSPPSTSPDGRPRTGRAPTRSTAEGR